MQKLYATILAVLICVILVYYYFQWSEIPCAGLVRLENCQFKTGDILWMKATDNIYATPMLCRFTHVGVCVRCPMTGTVYLYEAANPDLTKLLPHQVTNGIFVTNIKERISRYKGYCYLQPVNHEPSVEKINMLWTFIHDTATKFVYNKAPLLSAIRQAAGLQRMSYSTNCGELARLALIQLGILPRKSFDDGQFHCLWYLQDVNQYCASPYMYGPLYKIIDSPVGYAAQIAAHCNLPHNISETHSNSER